MRAQAQLESTSNSVRAPPPMPSPSNDRLADLLEQQLLVLTWLEEGLAPQREARRERSDVQAV
jgi:hypothetical protein